MTSVIDSALSVAQQRDQAQAEHEAEILRDCEARYCDILLRADSENPSEDDADALAWMISPDYLNKSPEDVRRDVAMIAEARRLQALRADAQGAAARAGRLRGARRLFDRQREICVRFLTRLASAHDQDREQAREATRRLSQLADAHPGFFERAADGEPQLMGTPEAAPQPSMPEAVSAGLAHARRLVDEAEETIANMKAHRRERLTDWHKHAMAVALWQRHEFRLVARDLQELLETGELPKLKNGERRSSLIDWFVLTAEHSTEIDALAADLAADTVRCRMNRQPQELVTAAEAFAPQTETDQPNRPRGGTNLVRDNLEAANSLGITIDEFEALRSLPGFPAATAGGKFDIAAIGEWMAEE